MQTIRALKELAEQSPHLFAGGILNIERPALFARFIADKTCGALSARCSAQDLRIAPYLDLRGIPYVIFKFPNASGKQRV